MKIAVIGVGFVGSTVANFLEKHQHEVIRVDPKYYDISVTEATNQADAAIVCVPTPSYLNGACDGALVAEVCEQIENDIPVMVKSTATPDIVATWPENIVTNPEFLRQANAEEDFENQHTFIIGADDKSNNAVAFFKNLFQPLLPNCEFFVTDRTTASMIKYTHNAWLATKVAWFHEMFSQIEGQVDYDTMTNILGRFPSIGNTHMQAPNSEGQLGYSGACFPKDVSALNHYIDHNILKQVDATNTELKKKKPGNYYMSQIKQRIPDSPFILFVGTSHTFGECNGVPHKNTFAEYICKELNLECFNVGFSGANNLELLQIVNELNTIDAFNNNCKMVVLEPRLTENTVITHTENYLPWHVIEDGIDRDSVRNKPLLASTRLGEMNLSDDGENLIYPVSLNHYLYLKIQGHRLNESTFRQAISGYYDEDLIEKTIDRDFLRETIKTSEARLAMEQKTMSVAFQDLVIIDAIKNIITSKGIPFSWMVVDFRRKYMSTLPKLYGGCTDVFKYLLFDECMLDVMRNHFGFETLDELDFLRCECQHFTHEGNEIIGSIMLPRIIDKLKD